MQTSQKAMERQSRIRDLLCSKGTLTLQELVVLLNCSEATIRNDLSKLEKEGVLQRVFGGAVANESTGRNSVISKRMNREVEEKKQIADYVVKNLIQPNMILTLDSGTTNMMLAKKIVDAKIPCTIVTNSFSAATIISKSPHIQLYLAGGFLDVQHESFHDDVSELIVKAYRSNLCFITPNGLDQNGTVTSSSIPENSIKQLMIRQADKTVVLADHTKLCNTELRVICYADSVDQVITDYQASAEQISMLTQAGLRIVHA